MIPFTYIYEGEEHSCLDTEAFDGAQFYGAIRKGRQVNTSQINPAAYVDCFRPVLTAGEDVLFVSMSSGISGSCQSARLAAAELKEEFPERTVAVVDTHGASLGEGLVALRGADLKDAGMPLEEAVQELTHMSKCMCQIFTVDDLMHLRRTGRLSNFSAIVGTMLMLKPLLIGNEDGKIVSFAKYRGRRRALQALARIYREQVVDPENQVIGIAHADCPEDVEALIAMLKADRPPKDIMTVMYEPVTGSHVGPDTLALFFLAGENVRTDKLVPDLIDSVKHLPGTVKNNIPDAVKDLQGAVKSRLPGRRNGDE